MATTKSTVVGIRLDHERRAWVEAEAARLGVSVRGLFEGMIDEARSEEVETGAERQEDPVAAPASTFRPSVDEVPASSSPEGPPGSEPQPLVNAPTTPSWPGVGSVTGVPGGLIREALSLSTSLIELSGRCATKRLSSCVLTRRFVGRP
jgi:hypothetical protein